MQAAGVDHIVSVLTEMQVANPNIKKIYIHLVLSCWCREDVQLRQRNRIKKTDVHTEVYRDSPLQKTHPTKHELICQTSSLLMWPLLHATVLTEAPHLHVYLQLYTCSESSVIKDTGKRGKR